MRQIVFAIALSTFLFVPMASAQQATSTAVPNLIRYGGTLKDANGAAVSSTATGVTFAIYQQQDGGAPVWMETQTVTPDASGNYSVVLGSTTATGLPADLFSQEEQRWLGVQVQGQAEQPRVLLVSVPYAFKAHEAETLGGKSAADFMPASSASGPASGSNAGNPAVALIAGQSSTLGAGNGANNSAPTDGPTNFSGSTTDQIVKVTQSSTGAGITAIAGTNAVFGQATGNVGNVYGVQGVATGSGGVALFGNANSPTGGTYGMKGSSTSTSGTGIHALASSTTGNTIGVSALVNSPQGTAAVFNNAGGGNILVGQNNGVAKLTVDGSGDVNALGTFTGNGSGLTGIQFSQLGGILQDSQFNGEYDNQINLTNSANIIIGAFTGSFNGTYVGNGSGLMGVLPAAGSTNYIQNNNSSPQIGASFNIDGFGIAGQTFSGNAVNSVTTYQIGPGPQGSAVLSIGNNPGNGNVFLGVGAGGNYPGSGEQNTFVGAGAGSSNSGGFQNTFTGVQAGSNTTFAQGNTFTGASAGGFNTTGINNSYYGVSAGVGGNGVNDIAIGAMAGNNNTNGIYNIYIGSPGQGGESNTIRIGTQGQQAFAYMAGIYGNSPSGALPVVINANGQMGASAGSGVTSWNGRTGAVVPQTGDYSFSMISGTLSPSQIPAGSTNYIQNGTTEQTSANFDISGSGSANSFVSATTYQIAGGGSVVGIGSPADGNLFLGSGAGVFNNAGFGIFNVFSGFEAGYNNTTGNSNTFSGYQAGVVNTTGSYNVFTGEEAGGGNTTGTNNVFVGAQAGGVNTSGGSNVFSGFRAGVANTTGGSNTFYGYQAGSGNTNGSQNIFIGNNAGSYITTGSSDIYIGTQGVQGDYNENNVMRLGDGCCIRATFIAGVWGGTVQSNGVAAYVDANGQIGTLVSSRRFKEQIEDMGDSTSPLMKLRPVTFLYKSEYSKGDRTLQYGLIAEEVAEIYPELVAYDKDGQPYTVRYQHLAPMLLNEVQKQYRRAEEQTKIAESQQGRIESQQREIESLRQQLQLQNATLQERLSRLEKLVEAQTVAEK